MDREAIIARLRAKETALRARDVADAALCNSRADSDTDILIEIDPDAHIGVWGYAGLKAYIARLFDRPVEVINREGLKPHVRPTATTDAVYAF
jgi:predicted nucleotidyltransferase